ncbi:S24 family peptidase [Yersinia rohdei]|uniref:S24 family peptidase n=1 Tax=Yersinia rohdei TaxID=29485 RepID=UPI00119CBDA0|nr:S24 family peptidase [Yersinia rohdei]
MKTLGERFKWRREQLGLTQEDAAKAINRLLKNERSVFTRVTISNIENGNQQSMKDKVLLAAQQVLKCSGEWLINGQDPIEPIKLESNVSTGSETCRMVPLIDWVQAGSFMETETHPEEDYEYYPCPEKCSSGTYALKVEGESMLPRFESGDIIYVDPAIVSPPSGKFVIARKEGSSEATFKQLQVLDDMRFLKALNPEYPPELKFLKVDEAYKIVGTIICHLKPV